MKHLSFSFLRARQVWKWNELGLIDIVDEAVQMYYSSSGVLENLICSKRKKSPVLVHVGLQEMITVGCWYIWWKRQQFVNGSPIIKSSISAFAINSLASNFYVATPNA
jgi:hypothetical protein